MLVMVLSTSALFAQTETNIEPRKTSAANVLDKEKWKQLDLSTRRGLEWLAKQQKEDGSFACPKQAQPGVTSFCLMAFLAQGESPADGKYQQQLTRVISFILDQQKPNGLIAATAPREVPIPRDVDHNTVGNPSVYNQFQAWHWLRPTDNATRSKRKGLRRLSRKRLRRLWKCNVGAARRRAMWAAGVT